MNKIKWVNILAARLRNKFIHTVLRKVSPNLYLRYIDSLIAKNPESRMIVDAMAIVGRIAIEFGLHKSPTLRSISTVVRGDLDGGSNYRLAESILTSSYPGRAFISAVVRNGEWDRRCKYNIADPEKRKLIDVSVRYFSIS